MQRLYMMRLKPPGLLASLAAPTPLIKYFETECTPFLLIDGGAASP